jgi:hypothetical protein
MKFNEAKTALFLNHIFSDHQPRQLVKWNQRFGYRLQTHHLHMIADDVAENGPRNVGLFWPPDAADGPRGFYWVWSP